MRREINNTSHAGKYANKHLKESEPYASDEENK